MQEFETGHLQFKHMISRYDEVIAQKANKTSLLAIEKKCKDKYARKDDLENQQKEFEEKIDSNSTKVEKLNKMIELLNENLSKDIHAAVRKVAKQMESQSNGRK